MGWLGTAIGTVGGAIIGGPIGAAVGGGVGSLLGQKGPRTPKVEREGYVYGGDPEYAARRRAELAQMGRDVYGRQVVDPNAGAEAVLADRMTAAQQAALARRLEGVVAGTGGPSAAELQMSRGQGVAAKNALQIAASGRGGNYAAGAVAAQNANLMGQQQVIGDAAILKAQEQERARAELAALYEATRRGEMAALGGAHAGQALRLDELRLNDAQYNALLQGELAINAGELGGTMGMSGALLEAEKMRIAQQEAHRDRMNALWGSLIQGAGGTGAALAGKV